MIYLDNNATTPIDDRVVEAMKPYLYEEYGNPSSKFYMLAENASKAIQKAREQVASLINADSSEIIFTSSGSEGNNFIIKGVSDYFNNYENKGNHLITSKVEHESIINSFKFLNGEIYMNKIRRKSIEGDIKKIDRGYKIDFIDVNSMGLVNLDKIEKTINVDTILGTFMMANNETGNINDIEDIANIFKRKDIFIHTDATQAVGRIDIDVKKLGIDAMTFSGHKMYGPKGIAAVYLKKGKYKMPDVTSLIHGGDNQEFGYRAGTLAVHDIVGFGKAADIAKNEIDSNKSNMVELENMLKDILLTKYKDVIFLTGDNHIPGVVSFIIPSLNNMIHIKKLSDIIALSSGSACSITGGSHVLDAMGYGEYKNNFFRISFNKYSTKEDIKIIKEYF